MSTSPAARGQTVLDVARENGIDIPTLCHLDGLSDVGACRLCCVEVAGAKRPLAACVTEVTDGMDVVTRSTRLDDHRRTIIEMLFVERNHICSVCVANNHCELQDHAQALGLTHFELPGLHPAVGVDASHDRFVIDHNRLHPVHTLRPCVCGDRRRGHLGRDRARRRRPGRHRSGHPVG